MIRKVQEKPLITDIDLSAILQLTNTDIVAQGKN